MVPALLAGVVLIGAGQAPLEPVRSSTYVGSHDVSRYEALYGEPMYWSLWLLVSPTEYEEPRRNQAIVTRGILSVFPRPGAEPSVRLCEDTLRYCFPLERPVPEIGAEFLADASFRNQHEAQVTGAFTEEGFIFWSVDTSPPRDRARAGASDRRLEELVTRPDRFVGQAITVRGRFRGANLFGEFAPDALPDKSGWVLRDGPFFVWITGQGPQGPGWRLDVASPADCVWNVEVDGKVERHGDRVSVKAKKVRLLGREADTACAEEARR